MPDENVMPDTFHNLKMQVIKWAEDREFFDNATPKGQAEKLQEEVGELLLGIGARDRDEVLDAIGDMQVVIINLCKMIQTSPEECLWLAYDQIKDRTGKFVNGKFVKDF
jgi:NTP pyrophosphatase (non-canonical NTP hydrolase)